MNTCASADGFLDNQDSCQDNISVVLWGQYTGGLCLRAPPTSEGEKSRTGIEISGGRWIRWVKLVKAEHFLATCVGFVFFVLLYFFSCVGFVFFCSFIFLLLCWICIFCSFVFLLLCWICIFCSLIFRFLCWICIFCTLVFLLLCWICILILLYFSSLCWICICWYFCISSSKGSLKICLTCVMLVVFIYIVDWSSFEVGLYPFRAILFLWKYLKEICLCCNFTISGKDFWRMSLKNFFHTQLYWSVQDSLSKLNFIHSRLRQIEAWVNKNFYFDFSRSENLV